MLKHIAVLPLLLLLAACSGETGKTGRTDGTLHRSEIFNAKWMAGLLDPASKAFLLVGEQGSILRSENGYDWSYADTPVTHRLNHINGDAGSGVLVAVGGGGTVLHSSDAGQSWHQPKIQLPAGVNLAATELTTVIHHPPTDTWIAAGSQNAILRSTDQAKSWRLTSYNSSPDQLKILALFVEPETRDIFFGAQYGTMGISKDAGVSWEITRHDMEAPGNYIPHIVDFYYFEDTMVAAADLGRLLVSQDRGQTWQLFKLPTMGYFTDAAYDPLHGSIVITSQKGEIAYSFDGGKNWKLQKLEVRNWPDEETPRLSAVRYDSKTRELLAMGNSGIVARSGDGGRTWRSDLLEPLFNLSLTTLLHDPGRGLFVAAGLGGFILTSKGLRVDPRAGWEVIRPGIDHYLRKAINIPGSDIFLAVGQLGAILRSEDDGRSWSFIEVAYPYPNQPPHHRDIIIDPQTGALIAVGPAGSIIRSSDLGKTWVPVFQGDITMGEAFTQILVDRKNKALIVPEVLYGSVYISSNGGVNWRKASTLPVNRLWHGDISEKSGVIVLAGKDGVIAYSEDGGHIWTAVYTLLEGNFYGVYAAGNGSFFAVGQKGAIMRSEDGGKTWQTMNSGTISTLRRIVADPKTGALLAFGQDGVIVRSEDAGVNWRPVANPASEELREALIEPGTDNLLIVGRNGAVLRSADGGKNWEALPSHTSQHFRSAGVNPKTGTLIAVGDSLVRLSRNSD